MFDIGASELLVIGVVALLVVGPKELPGLIRTVGQATAKLRRMAGEFRGQFDEAMREAELHDAQKTVQDIRNAVTAPMSGLNPLETIRREFGALKTDVNNSINGHVPANLSDGLPASVTATSAELSTTVHETRTDVPLVDPYPVAVVQQSILAAPLQPNGTHQPIVAEASSAEFAALADADRFQPKARRKTADPSQGTLAQEPAAQPAQGTAA